MRPVRPTLYVFASVLILSPIVRCSSRDAAQPAQSPPILAKRVHSLNVRGLCLVDALLRLGRQERIPLGIEYVDREALEKPIGRDFGDATVAEIIRALLGEGRGYTWWVRDGVLDISNKSVASRRENLLDRLLPDFRVPKCPVGDASNALYMSLSSQLHPGITGYAGEYSPGSSRGLVGPLQLRNARVRDILNCLVSRTDGKAAWVVQVPPGHLNDLPSRGLWMILEYESAPREYAGDLLGRVFGR